MKKRSRGVIDLSNQRFGKLVAKKVAGRDKYNRATWLCICDCGTEKVIQSGNLRSGNTRSCGCEKNAVGKGGLRDLTGRKFGRLTVVERDMDFIGKVYWLCECTCGNRTVVWMGHLVTDHTKSCGCLKHESRGGKTPRSSSKMARWSKFVRDSNGNRCFTCGSNSELEAHHLDSYKENKKRRTDVSNGVPLCKTCHLDFHKKYGFTGVTAEQFHEYAGLPSFDRDLVEVIESDDVRKGKVPEYLLTAVEVAKESNSIGKAMRILLYEKQNTENINKVLHCISTNLSR